VGKKNWMDQSSIYGQQHNTFYRWVLYPVLILLMFIVMFLLFAKKEMVIKSSAQINAETEKIQIPINGQIKKRNFHENQKVKKGDCLIEFDAENFLNEKKLLENNNNELKKQQEAGQTFIESILQNKNLFLADDSYGYSSQLKSILAEKDLNEYSIKQSIAVNELNRKNYNEKQTELSRQINVHQSERDDLKQLLIAWNNNENIDNFSSLLKAQYNNWKLQLSNASNEQKELTKSNISVEIENQIDQLNKEIEQIKLDKLNSEEPSNIDNDIKMNNEKNKQLENQSLSTIKQKMIDLSNEEKKNNTSLISLNSQIEASKLLAPKSGILHVENDIFGQNMISKGTIIAEIFPQKSDKKLRFTTLIPANEIANVKCGMAVHFKLDQKDGTPAILEGTLSEIPESSTETKQGSFYIVKGHLKSKSNVDTRYGLNGQLSIIVGKKTYGELIEDILKR